MDRFERLLVESQYHEQETRFLMQGFRHGFSIGYEGPRDVVRTSKNIPIKTGVGSQVEMWNKIMKEVKLKRFVGPFRKDQFPFKFFIQSPIILVPKGTDQTD